MLHSPVVNLSCGNCKATQSFSGDPPKCDVCGWTCGSEPVIQQYEFRRHDWIVVIAIVGCLFTFAICQGLGLPIDFSAFVALIWLPLLFLHSGFRRLLDRLMRGLAKVVALMIGVGVVLGAIYFTVRFIKWCWYH
jgi:hypothetical protein